MTTAGKRRINYGIIIVRIYETYSLQFSYKIGIPINIPVKEKGWGIELNDLWS